MSYFTLHLTRLATIDPEKFGQATFKLVRTLQEQLNSRLDIPKEHKPGVQNGDVDEKTADALNFLLGQLGALH